PRPAEEGTDTQADRNEAADQEHARGGERRPVHHDGFAPVRDCEPVMPVLAIDLWSLTRGRPEVDPADLAAAIQEEAGRARLDYRTRLLTRDSVAALRDHWGDEKFANWLSACPSRNRIEAIRQEPFERPGFSLEGRLMEKTDPEAIRQYLRDLGARLQHAV